jgi:ADP-ribose pyrophosphatase YjhB (NUDIX family)
VASELPVAPPSEVFRHCPRCAAPRGAEVDAIRFVCGACGFVYYYNVAVSSGAVVLDPAGHALFIRRARAPGKDKLAFPGGFVDRGETAQDAAIREVREETGVVLPAVEFLASFPNLYPYRDVEYAVLDLFFVATVPSREATPLDEVTEIVWGAPESLREDDLAFPSHVLALAALRRR